MEAAIKEGPGAITISVCGWRDWPQISPQWSKLFAQSGASFFLSNDWITTWLDVFGEQLQPEILLFKMEQELVGACLLVRRVVWQKKFLPLRRIYLNCAGEDEADATCIEYNRLLCLPGHERDAASALQRYLQEESWDELILEGIEPHEGSTDLCPGAYRQQVTEKPCWYVDLAAIRMGGGTYESTLSANTRQQVRRSIRKYETAGGPVSLQLASTVAEALDFLEKLADLHQKAWVERGTAGVFASAKFSTFHRRLIERSFSEGSVHLIRVNAGEQTIGLLYNFVYAGRVYFYQSGFAYGGDSALKPGLVTHFLAIQHYLAGADVSEYDFLAGNSQYKRSLGRSQRSLEWRVAQRGTLGVKSVEALRTLRDTYRALRKRDSGVVRPADAEAAGPNPPQDSDS